MLPTNSKRMRFTFVRDVEGVRDSEYPPREDDSAQGSVSKAGQKRIRDVSEEIQETLP